MGSTTFQAKPHGNSKLANRIGLAIVPASIVIVFAVFLANTDQENAVAVVLVTVVGLLFIYGMQLLDWYGPALGLHGNLQLDDGGLTWRNDRWRWSELSAFALYDLGPGRRFIRFEAPESEGQLMAVSRRFHVAPGRREIRIRDQFDAPLEEIAAGLNKTRQQALGGETGAPETSGTAGTPTVYFSDVEKTRSIGSYVPTILFYLAFIWMVINRIFPIWFGPAALAAIIADAGIRYLVRYRLFPTAPPAGNFLRLDNDSLIHARRGTETSWSWHEVSSFRIRGGGYMWRLLLGGFSIITAEAPDDARLSRLWRWTSRIFFGGPVLIIADIYLGRPEDIAATLNEYRARVLGGGK